MKNNCKKERENIDLIANELSEFQGDGVSIQEMIEAMRDLIDGYMDISGDKAQRKLSQARDLMRLAKEMINDADDLN